MRLALLGCDDEALDLVASVLADERHALVAAYDAAAHEPRLRILAPAARFDDDWESLLVADDVDALIVARGRFDPSAESGYSADERRSEQLRKLAQAAVPLLAIHPACEMIVGYELEMIRADSGGVMQPFVPALDHPAMTETEALAFSEPSPLGEIEQILLERQMADRSRSAVLTQFARDASLLRRWIGMIRQVAAAGLAGTEYRDPLATRMRTLPSLANLSVHLTGERSFTARWSVGPIGDFAGAKLVLVGSRGRATLRMPDGSHACWELSTTTVEGRTITYPPFDAAATALIRLQSAILAGEPQDNAWLNACRDLEAASLIDRSLEKGRAIALYTDDVSEEQSFKGVMAVGGCLVLAATMAGLAVVVLVEALQFDFRRSPLWRAWPIYLVAPVLVFLVLQMLKGVARRRPQQSVTAPENPAERRNSAD